MLQQKESLIRLSLFISDEKEKKTSKILRSFFGMRADGSEERRKRKERRRRRRKKEKKEGKKRRRPRKKKWRKLKRWLS